MSEIILFPTPKKQQNPDLETLIDNALNKVPDRDREKIKFELIKTLDSYDTFFSEWSLNMAKDADEALKKQIYDIAHQEHSRKMRMLEDIIKLKLKLLVAEYDQRLR